MQIVFLEFCGLLLIFVVITQIIIPILFPTKFDLFWLFRKDKKLEDRSPVNTGDKLRNTVKEAVGLKRKTDKVIKDARKRTKENLNDAQSLDKTVKDLE
ncbi:MAG: hypothetical protein WC795_02920 [Candidatus Paceibacterota bacterium]|jgi:hypothetical protein